jgi:periplasmic divalent cation tolerance protein
VSRYSLVYVTTASKSEAARIAERVLRLRLAAGSNILSPVASQYWWKGKLQRSTEAILTLKTKSSLVAKLIKQVKALHSYDCPCIIEIPLGKGYDKFFQWLDQVI